MKQRRLMLLGSSSEYIEITKLARKMGIYVVICDGYENGFAREYADKCYTIPVSNTQEIAEICKLEKIDRVIGSFSDYLFECMVRISDAAGLPTYISIDKLEYFRNKDKMAEMFEELGISQPKSAIIEYKNIDERIVDMKLPMIIKPISGWGSHGVKLIKNNHEVKDYFTDSKAGEAFIIQEYNDGEEYNCSSWIIDGVAHFIELEKKWAVKNEDNDMGSVLGAVFSQQNNELKDEIIEVIQKIATFSGIVNGPMCIQFFVNNGEIQICEVAARFFAYSQNCQAYRTGINISQLLLLTQFEPEKLKSTFNESNIPKDVFVSTIYIQIYDCVIANDSNFLDMLKEENIVKSLVLRKIGEEPLMRRESYYGFVIFEHKNYEKLLEITKDFHKRMKVLDKAGNNILIK